MGQKTALIIMTASLVCGWISNHLGRGMAMQVLARSNRRHVFTVLNFRLAQHYRELFGSNRTYWQFVVFNLVYVLGFVGLGIYALFYWAMGK